MTTQLGFIGLASASVTGCFGRANSLRLDTASTLGLSRHRDARVDNGTAITTPRDRWRWFVMPVEPWSTGPSHLLASSQPRPGPHNMHIPGFMHGLPAPPSGFFWKGPTVPGGVRASSPQRSPRPILFARPDPLAPVAIPRQRRAASAGSLRHCFVRSVVGLEVCATLLKHGHAPRYDGITVPCTSLICLPHSSSPSPHPSDDDESTISTKWV